MASAGDLVHVSVVASDDTGVVSVTADSVQLTYISGNLWEGDILVNPDIGLHNVEVIALDAAQNPASDSSA